ncbi:MAG: hypothetical protein FWD82_10570, partial [Defluviitaleaceae bacterium]|nr:hypothetical protein [Defluviitaleaceae bacterium]
MNYLGKKTTKRFLSLIIAIVMFMGYAPMEIFADDDYGGYEENTDIVDSEEDYTYEDESDEEYTDNEEDLESEEDDDDEENFDFIEISEIIDIRIAGIVMGQPIPSIAEEDDMFIFSGFFQDIPLVEAAVSLGYAVDLTESFFLELIEDFFHLDNGEVVGFSPIAHAITDENGEYIFIVAREDIENIDGLVLRISLDGYQTEFIFIDGSYIIEENAFAGRVELSKDVILTPMVLNRMARGGSTITLTFFPGDRYAYIVDYSYISSSPPMYLLGPGERPTTVEYDSHSFAPGEVVVIEHVSGTQMRPNLFVPGPAVTQAPLYPIIWPNNLPTETPLTGLDPRNWVVVPGAPFYNGWLTPAAIDTGSVHVHAGGRLLAWNSAPTTNLYLVPGVNFGGGGTGLLNRTIRFMSGSGQPNAMPPNFGGSGVQQSVDIRHVNFLRDDMTIGELGLPFPEPLPTVTITGHQFPFTGWYTRSSAAPNANANTWVDITPETTLGELTGTPRTIHAIYGRLVTFDANGGAFAESGTNIVTR